MKYKDKMHYRSLSPSEIEKEITELTAKREELDRDKFTKPVKNVRMGKAIKTKIALLKTLQKERVYQELSKEK